MADKTISELPIASTINPADISILVSNNTDYQFSFTTLLAFIAANLPVGATNTFGTTVPQNNTGNNGDVFIKTDTAAFYQKTNGTWAVVYTMPATDDTASTLLYGTGIPGSTIGTDNSSYIDTTTGIFYLKTSGSWAQVFSMATGPQGPQGTAGTNGSNGTNGNTILNGTVNPSNTLGNNGDYYINNANLSIFGPKSAGVWPAGASITGADGAGVVPGGTTAQLLTKKSNTDFDTEWVDPPPLGDLSTLVTTSKTNIVGAINEIAGDINTETSSRANADIALQTNINNKVDKVAGYGLSENDYTSAEKTKLATLSEHYKGTYTTSAALSTANPTGNPGDYGYVDPGTGENAQMYIWDEVNIAWVLSSGSTGTIPDATETNAGIIAIATLTQALAGTDNTNAMTALKTLSVILDQKKNVNYQIAPVSLNEVSFLMQNAGNIMGITISGASNPLLKTGLSGTYPTTPQTFPYAYAAGDRIFVTYNYTDLTNASCNIILTCRDN